MVCGVAKGLAERIGVPVLLLRTIFVAAFIASPLSVLVYLLLSISIPSEVKVVSNLRLLNANENLQPRERFEQLSQLLSERIIGNQPRRPALFAIGLFGFAMLLEFLGVSGHSFYRAHPVLASLFNELSRLGYPAFYAGIAMLFLTWRKQRVPIPALTIPIRYRFSCDRGAGKMIGGVVAGVSEMLALDPVFLRVLFVLLNILTMGLAGAAYLIVWYVDRSDNESIFIAESDAATASHANIRPFFRFGFALLFLLLAFIQGTNAYRMFFFNEQLFVGTIMSFAGLSIVWKGLVGHKEQARIWIVGGAAFFFFGIYQLASMVGHLQISLAKSFEVAEMIIALSMVYLGGAALRGYTRSIAFVIAGIFAFSSLLIATGFISQGYLLELARFYDFFYPLIFAGLGLWIAFER